MRQLKSKKVKISIDTQWVWCCRL